MAVIMLQSAVHIAELVEFVVPVVKATEVNPPEANTPVEHSFGVGLTWSFDDTTGTLRIKCNGAIPDYVSEEHGFDTSVIYELYEGKIDTREYAGLPSNFTEGELSLMMIPMKMPLRLMLLKNLMVNRLISLIWK